MKHLRGEDHFCAASHVGIFWCGITANLLFPAGLGELYGVSHCFFFEVVV